MEDIVSDEVVCNISQMRRDGHSESSAPGGDGLQILIILQLSDISLDERMTMRENEKIFSILKRSLDYYVTSVDVLVTIDRSKDICCVLREKLGSLLWPVKMSR